MAVKIELEKTEIAALKIALAITIQDYEKTEKELFKSRKIKGSEKMDLIKDCRKDKKEFERLLSFFKTVK